MKVGLGKRADWSHLLLAILLASPYAHAGDKKKATPPPSPTAPIPAAIRSARTIFLSNACELDTDHCTSLYNDFYAGIAALGSYKLVLEPKGADLIFEFHDSSVVSSVSGFNGNVSSSLYFQSQLLIKDPLTQVVLWSFAYGDAGGGPSPAGILIGQFMHLLEPASSAQSSNGLMEGTHPQPPSTKSRLSNEN